MEFPQLDRSRSTGKHFESENLDDLLGEEAYFKTPKLIIQTTERAKELQKRLNASADEIGRINEKRNGEKADGSGVSIAGDALGIVGTLAAPVSGGLSLIFAVAGSYVSYKGGNISSTAEKELETQINSTMESCISEVTAFHKEMVEWNEIIALLKDVTEELSQLFSDLELEFEKGLKALKDCKYRDQSSYKIQIFLKCLNNIYVVARSSNFIVKQSQTFHNLLMNTQNIKTMIQTGSEVVDLTKGFVEFGVSTSSTAFSTSKEIGDTGTKIISTLEKSKTVTKTTKLSFAAESTVKISKSKALGKTAAKQTVTAAKKSVCKASLGLSLIFTAVDLWQYRSARLASESKCDAEKELRSMAEDIGKIVIQARYQTDVYKQIMKIEKTLSDIVKYASVTSFLDESIKKIVSSINKIHKLRDKMA